MKQKAQLSSLQAIVITLVIVGVLLGIGFMVLEEFQNTTDNVVNTVNNETIAISATGYAYVTKNVSTANINCYNAFTVIRMTNASTAGILTNTNYTFDAFGKVMNATNIQGKSWNVTYTYKSGDSACGGITDTITATAEIPTWLSIIVILLIVGVLLAIVFNVIPNWGRGSTGGTTAEI